MTLPTYYASDSYRNNFIEPPTFTERLTRGLHHHLGSNVSKPTSRWNAGPHFKTHTSGHFWNPRRLITTPNVLIILWVALLWWGERFVFTRSISNCDWTTWERWVCFHRNLQHCACERTYGAGEAYTTEQYSLKKRLPIIWSS